MAVGPIVLIGFMGVGKTSVGRAIASALGQSFLDLDEAIQLAHGPINHLFSAHGELHFRALECAALANALTSNLGVIATGGGIVTYPESLQLLKGCSQVVWLRAPLALVEERIQADAKTNRPLADTNLGTRFHHRQPLYSDCATTCIDIHRQSIEEIAQKIINGYR